MAEKRYDFGGWATRNDLLCSDGRTIRADAFKECDGETVPLVWGHDHGGPKTILGHALLMNKPEGVYTYGCFNNSEDGLRAKEEVAHGDIRFLSIYATHLKQQAGNVLKGKIREVSLVPYGGANPGAFIDNAVLAHADGTYDMAEDEAIIFSGYQIDDTELLHEDKGDAKEETKVADEKKAPENEDKKEEKKGEGRSVQDVLDDMTDEQLQVVAYLMEEAAKGGSKGNDDDDEDDDEVKHSYDEGEDDVMKYNAFENEAPRANVLTHSDQEAILKMAKDSRIGSFKNALKEFEETNELMHADSAYPVGGFATNDAGTRGYTSFEAVLPEFQEVRPGAPELVTDDQGWVQTVISKTHKSPISRSRTSQVDIRRASDVAAGLRAKGYQKGNKKLSTGNIKLVRRTTEPQTIYVRNNLHKDDIIDITDFDYVQYLYNIDRQMYYEELATAILFGDGRDDSAADKIFPDKVRPIWTDDDLYTIHYDMTGDKEDIQGSNTTGYFGANYVEAEAMVNACLFAREAYRGSGNPDMFIHPHKLNVMLLARDRNGRRIYSSKAELATTLNVNNIYTVDKMIGLNRTVTEDGAEKTKQLNALIVNLGDYSVGSTKGGQVTHITQFDIDFNQEKSLLESRQSGALTRIYSAIAIEEDVTQEEEETQNPG